MTLAPGSRIGRYEVVAPAGSGGMGEVYRATDSALKRTVALKVLPALVAADPDRLARFQREAEMLAALSHPNIASIFGLEASDGVKALVMEFVEGPTLADRIDAGPVPPDETIQIAVQIAEALESAHELGIVHRDLKPANVKLRPDGAVKVLDFGLAKSVLSGARAADAVPSDDDTTITSPAMTAVGTMLGTASYMAPEQARGRPVDRHADIWAFGCVLYELLTGRRAFPGDTTRGNSPVWAPGGRRLYFRGGGVRIMAAEVAGASAPAASTPVEVATFPRVIPTGFVEPLPDGRLLALGGRDISATPELRLVFGWLEVREKVR